MTFKKELAEIEKEIQKIKANSDLTKRDYIETIILEEKKSQLIKDHKAEKIRFEEFVEKLKRNIYLECKDKNIYFVKGYDKAINDLHKEIDKLTKEMIGEAKGK